MLLVFRDNRLGVPRVVPVNMGDGLVHAVHSFYRKDIVQVLGAPVLFCSRRHGGNRLPGRLVAPQLHLLFRKLRRQHGQEGVLHLPVHHQRLAGIADADALGLRIVYNIYRHGKIRILIHIDVAVSGTCLDDRDRALVHHGGNEPRASSGNQHVYVPVQLHEFRRRLPAGVLKKLDGVSRTAAVRQRLLQHLHDGQVGMDGVASSP